MRVQKQQTVSQLTLLALAWLSNKKRWTLVHSPSYFCGIIYVVLHQLGSPLHPTSEKNLQRGSRNVAPVLLPKHCSGEPPNINLYVQRTLHGARIPLGTQRLTSFRGYDILLLFVLVTEDSLLHYTRPEARKAEFKLCNFRTHPGIFSKIRGVVSSCVNEEQDLHCNKLFQCDGIMRENKERHAPAAALLGN